MDTDGLLFPLAGDQPSGVDLRNDARFHAIERLLEPAARQHRIKGDGSVNEAAPPVDWTAILSEGQALAADGRDLRLLVVLVRGLFATQGFEGLSQGLQLLVRSIGDYWDSIHPVLRERDDPLMAAMARTNALRQLENDDNGLLCDLRFGIAFAPRGIGPVPFSDLAAISLSDFEVLARAASGLSQTEKDAILARHNDRAGRAKLASRAMAAEQPDEIAAMVAGIGACLAGIETLCATYGEMAGFGATPGLSLPALTEVLTNCRKALEKAIAESGSDVIDPSAESAGIGGANGAAIPALAEAPTASAPPGEINSRSDVEAALDRIVAFYERTEPSSPIPHVTRRLRRMVAMDFLQLMEEVAPSGLKEFRNIAGIEETRKQ